MRLFLHIGTEKTGSSFLQTIAARNRGILLEAGIYYPLPKKRRRDLLQGRVSPGNGFKLKRLLGGSTPGELKEWLSDLKRLSIQSGATALFLSNEQLLNELASEEKLVKLLESCSDAGICSIEIMLVLRDPVDQCLSLHRHRAKHGQAAPLDQWLSESFKLPVLLKKLRETFNRTGVPVNVMRYSPDGSVMLEKFFNQWLKVDLGEIEIASVNRSLTFSELEVIRSARSLEPKLVPFIFERLDSLDPAEKASDVERERWARAIAQSVVFSEKHVWTIWNDRLPANDQLLLPTGPGESVPEPCDIVLSSAQAAAVLQVVRHAARLSFRAELFAFRVRRFFGRLIRRNAT